MSYFQNDILKRIYSTDMEKNREKYLSMQKRVRDILGEDYDRLYLFLWKRLNANMEYTILMSRRCLVICQIFIVFFYLDGMEINGKTKVISDRSLPYYKKELKGKTVQIVDDILIHGRTITGIFKAVSEITGANPDVYVYMEYSSMECISSLIMSYLSAEREAGICEWRNLSDQLVSVIHAANFAYTSFVFSYIIFDEKKEFYKKLMKRCGNLVIDNTEKLQYKYGVASKGIFDSEILQYPLFSSLTLECCMRVYFSDVDCKLVLIPYAFMKALPKYELNTVYERMGNESKKMLPKVSEIFLSKPEDNADMEFKSRLLTCLLSVLYWACFGKKYQELLTQNWFVDLDTIAKSFDDKIALELSKIQELNVDTLLNVKFEFEEMDLKGKTLPELNDTLLTCVKSGKGSVTNNCEMLHRYFHNAWKIDEERASQQKDRLPGLPTESFMEHFKNNGREICASLINAWDTGIATSNYYIQSNQDYVADFNAPGEQSYRLLLCQYPYLMKILIWFSKNYQGVDYDNSEYICQKKKHLNRLVDLFSEKYSLDLSELHQVINDNDGDMSIWNSIDTLDAYTPEDNRESEQIVHDYLQNIKW